MRAGGKASVLLLLLLLLGAVACSAVRVYSVEMRFKQADEQEKAERLRLLHEHQIKVLKEDDISHELMARLRGGKTASFPGDMTTKNSIISAPISFGGQTFDVCLDTGSAVLWVASNACKSSSCDDLRLYDANKSSTFQPLSPETFFEIEYGSGTVAGKLAKETVAIGHFAVSGQLFGVATSTEGQSFRKSSTFTGLLGLAYPSLGSFKHITGSDTPFFDSIMREGLLSENGFSFWLVRTSSHPPMFFLGAPPQKYYQGQLKYFPVVKKHYWTIALHDILVDNKSIGVCSPENPCDAVIDSGTTYMGAPSKDLDAILYAVQEEDATDECDSKPEKVITYVLEGGRTLTLEADYYYTRSASGKYCKVKYMGIDVDPPHGPLHIFGDVLFRKYFIHFDRDNDRVGFAEANRDVKPDTSIQSLLMKKLLDHV